MMPVSQVMCSMQHGPQKIQLLQLLCYDRNPALVNSFSSTFNCCCLKVSGFCNELLHVLTQALWRSLQTFQTFVHSEIVCVCKGWVDKCITNPEGFALYNSWTYCLQWNDLEQFVPKSWIDSEGTRTKPRSLLSLNVIVDSEYTHL